MSDIYMDISPLMERQWSGIARVTAELARGLLERGMPNFFYGNYIVDNELVRQLLDGASFYGLEILLKHKALRPQFLPHHADLIDSVALYTNLKTDNKKFGRFCLIVYDLSFAITPEFHNHEMTEGYRKFLYDNTREASRILAISAACKHDLIQYYQVEPDKIFVSTLGCRTRPQIDFNHAVFRKPYFLILGTIEPRKNIGLVLDYVKANMHILDSFDFVFVGKEGWGKPWAEYIDERNIDDERVRHIGFVSDELRDQLLSACAAVIFPSFFEGFGLPVLEAMAYNKIVIASRSSGIIEAGGGNSIDFDPTSFASFAEAMHIFLSMSDEEKDVLRARCLSFAKMQTWSGFIDRAFDGFQLELN